MNSKPQFKGIVLKVDPHGSVLEIIRNDFKKYKDIKSVIELSDKHSIGKMLTFLSTLNKEKSAIGWEINVNYYANIESMFFSGAALDSNYIIVGSADLTYSRKLFNELMAVNNEQTNTIRKNVKENISLTKNIEGTHDSFNELSKLNNEMVNMQRQLAKKNNDLEKLNLVLQQKNAELDQFAYIVSHDLKAPLRGINSVLQMIEEDLLKPEDEEIREMFKLVNKRVVRMNDLISSILEYSRAGKSDDKISTFNLKDLLEEIIDSLGYADNYKFTFNNNLPEFTTSYVQLSQVLSNLMGNAAKYHNKSTGTIRVLCEKKDKNFALIRVIDDGPGIPEKYHSTIFGMGETAHAESRTDSTGVGLAIVKKLVEMHDGEIGLSSEVGKGSEFWFTWPFKK